MSRHIWWVIKEGAGFSANVCQQMSSSQARWSGNYYNNEGEVAKLKSNRFTQVTRRKENKTCNRNPLPRPSFFFFLTISWIFLQQ